MDGAAGCRPPNGRPQCSHMHPHPLSALPPAACRLRAHDDASPRHDGCTRHGRRRPGRHASHVHGRHGSSTYGEREQGLTLCERDQRLTLCWPPGTEGTHQPLASHQLLARHRPIAWRAACVWPCRRHAQPHTSSSRTHPAMTPADSCALLVPPAPSVQGPVPPGDDKAAAAQAQAGGMPPGMPPGMPMPFFAPPGHFFANPMAMQASMMFERAPVNASCRLLPLSDTGRALASKPQP